MSGPRPEPAGLAAADPSRRDSERGSALVVALMVLATIGVLAVAIVLSSISDRHVSSLERDSADALAAAESGVAVAKRMIQDLTAPLADGDADGQADFTINAILPWGGQYRVVAEAGEISDPDLSAYRSDGFTIVSEGRSARATRRVKVQMAHDSFLKYARFVESTGTSYTCDAVITGEIYLGGDLTIPTCTTGDEVTFLEFVATTGDIPNAPAGVFMRGYVTDASQIDLQNSVDFDAVRDIARGLAPESDCEGHGSVGYYENPGAGFDPIGITSTGGVLQLELFDFADYTTSPGDTLIRYNHALTTNTVTGQPMRLSEFNGIIFVEGDARVKGTMDGKSAHSVTVYAADDVVIDHWIVTGHKGFDPGTGIPNGAGDPVNIGLVARDYVYLGPVPRICRIDAALMAVNSNWRAISTSPSAHPPYLIGPVDLDMDSITGETPVNDDPSPGVGWDELNLTPDHWVLNINGPIITHNAGNAAPWATVLGPGPTRRYNYDLDITDFPPPCFPVPLNLWVDIAWNEIFDSETPLEEHLP